MRSQEPSKLLDSPYVVWDLIYVSELATLVSMVR